MAVDERDAAILTEGLRKHFPGRGAAVDGLDLAVAPGTVHGLLGPNGAGKTTTVRILSTLQPFDSGRVRVAGRDVARDPAGVRARIGVAGQHAAVDDVLSGRQNLEMFARLQHLRARAARERADALLEHFDLQSAADRPVGHYSGGMRRRLDLAISLIRRAQVLFLDEPTTGLDPRSRSEVWGAIRDLASTGTTVLLTTQYLEEADRLCSRSSMIDRGRVVAEGSPAELKARVGDSRVEIAVPAGLDLTATSDTVASALGTSPQINTVSRRVTIPVRGGTDVLTRLARGLDGAGLSTNDISLRGPDLDEVFLRMAGPAMPEEAGR